MALKIIAVGSLKGWPKTACSEYEKRLRAPWQLKLIEIPTPSRRQPQAQKLEAKKILKSLSPHEHVILLDPAGQRLSSEKFAQHLNVWMEASKSMAFILGGPDGFDEQIKQRANAQWSLSDLTLPHPLARVILTEQIYRAYTLLHNHPYHRA